jgi:NitT/TauT family transport system ATP-binding protein
VKLSIRGVTKEFLTDRGKVCALDETSVEIKSGEFVCFVGPSGCGKTTLLNLAAGLESPTNGVIQADGKPVTGPGSDRVVIFQEAALFPWLNVVKNVEFGLARRMDRKKRGEIARTLLSLVHLNRFTKSYVHELSGGMKSRVALARALALNPSVLLMDEPFAALDAQTRDLLHEELQEIWKTNHQTILFVTHNVREAVRLGDRVLVFTARPGRIKKEFRIDLPRPRDINRVYSVTPVKFKKNFGKKSKKY